jgi:membrane fusion protein, multidrug efflux system
LILRIDPNGILIPSQAIQTGQQGQFVYVVRPDQTVQSRPVEVGDTLGDRTVINRGLSAGETIVTTGQMRLSDGAKVAVTDHREQGRGNRQ